MPCRQSRSDTGRGPGDRSGHGGRSGSINAHNSSSTIHGRLPTPHERPNRHVGHARPGNLNKIVLRALNVPWQKGSTQLSACIRRRQTRKNSKGLETSAESMSTYNVPENTWSEVSSAPGSFWCRPLLGGRSVGSRYSLRLLPFSWSSSRSAH